MFTGLIESVGRITELKSRGNYHIITVESSLDTNDIALGESISCDGACLTVVSRSEAGFTVEASQETAARTILGHYTTGAGLNLERALKSGARLGGHFVSGHVDDIGQVDYARMVGESLEIAVTFDPKWDPYIVDKGSIAINGVSLTVNQTRSGWFTVNVIPYTAKDTTLADFKKGARVNLEFDLLGKYIVKMLGKASDSHLTLDKLRESGW